MIKIGVDLLLNERFDKYSESPEFNNKIFHASELKNKDRLKSIFCLKEASMKAIGGKVGWKDIEVRYIKSGKPKVLLSDNIKPEGFISSDASVSHDGEYTLGFVAIELE